MRMKAMTLENIERCCQLHESVELTYVVDGYVATLTTHDGYRPVLRVRGDSALGALVRLDARLKTETLASVRAKLEEKWRTEE